MSAERVLVHNSDCGSPELREFIAKYKLEEYFKDGKFFNAEANIISIIDKTKLYKTVVFRRKIINIILTPALKTKLSSGNMGKLNKLKYFTYIRKNDLQYLFDVIPLLEIKPYLYTYNSAPKFPGYERHHLWPHGNSGYGGDKNNGLCIYVCKVSKGCNIHTKIGGVHPLLNKFMKDVFKKNIIATAKLAFRNLYTNKNKIQVQENNNKYMSATELMEYFYRTRFNINVKFTGNGTGIPQGVLVK